MINKKKKAQLSAVFKVGNMLISDKKIAHTFNHYFDNVGQILASKIPDQTWSPLQYLKGNYPNSLFLVPVLENEIITITNNLKNTAPGLDDIRADVVKHIIHLISKPLMHTFNLSLEQGVFPNELKVAKVTPI